jgi:hypothetical protein
LDSSQQPNLAIRQVGAVLESERLLTPVARSIETESRLERALTFDGLRVFGDRILFAGLRALLDGLKAPPQGRLHILVDGDSVCINGRASPRKGHDIRFIIAAFGHSPFPPIRDRTNDSAPLPDAFSV